jgi:chloramphenicol-sensitive protein RarD
MNSPASNPSDSVRHGIMAGLTAYLVWGLVPVFFKQFHGISAVEIIAHRVVWSLLLMGGVLFFGSGYAQVWSTTRNPRKLARVALGSLMVLINWLIFVYGVNTDQILATSLGYFILPLLNVAIGVMVLGERLRRAQWLAVAFAAAGVLIETLRVGSLPWISLALAGSFAFYGVLRKQLAMDSASGLFLETACIAPVAIIYLLWLDHAGVGHFGEAEVTSALLVASGPVTAIPLLLFAIAARRLPLNTMGFLQYLAPSISFMVAVLVYAEPMNLTRSAGFTAIWVGLAIYTLDMWRQSRRSASL